MSRNPQYVRRVFIVLTNLVRLVDARNFLKSEFDLVNRSNLANDFMVVRLALPATPLVLVAVGSALWLTENQFQYLKDLRPRIPSAWRSFISVSQGKTPQYPNHPVFWEWVNSLGYTALEVIE